MLTLALWAGFRRSAAYVLRFRGLGCVGLERETRPASFIASVAQRELSFGTQGASENQC